jgi:hypothetical protein
MRHNLASFLVGALLLLLVGIGRIPAFSRSADPSSSPAKQDSQPGKSHALLLVGLPGDEEHEKSFATTALQWRNWLTDTLDFEPDEVRVLFGRDGRKGLAKGPATREAIEREVADLKKTLRPEDRLWVFFLGHGDYDGEHARFHLPKRDLREDDCKKLFSDLPCREQVFWLTMPASGWFLRSLSAKGRIVITATAADEEYNETEFPQALATVCGRPLEQLDTNKDGKLSVLELYRHTVAEVQARFAADKRVPTEHALLDDNGDGTGTEEPILKGADPQKKPTADGPLAAQTFLPFKKKAKD